MRRSSPAPSRGTVAEGDIGDVVTATGTLSISDVDAGDNPAFADTTVNGAYGSLALVGGNWTYTLDQATAQSLDDGDTVTDTLTLTASDGTVQNITITVNGTEDAPVVAGTFTGTVAEGDIGDVVTATGTIVHLRRGCRRQPGLRRHHGERRLRLPRPGRRQLDLHPRPGHRAELWTTATSSPTPSR